jgi:phosphoribosyl 1,2-cyclic phosphodiesterase
MQLTFLGTAASEGFPDPFCRCAGCVAARQEGGRSLRLHSAALINDDLLIDHGPSLLAAAMKLGIDLGGVAWALQTHPHGDHLDALTLFGRSRQCRVEGLVETHLHCAPATLDRIDAFLSLSHRTESIRDPVTQAMYALRISEIAPWQAVTMGPYRVQSVAASHDEGHEAMLFAIEDTRSGGRAFYGTDTGPLPAGTWERLAELGWAFDLLILDHTFGFGKRSSGHLNADQFLEEVTAARAAGVIGEETRVIATHLGHHSHPAHAEITAWAADRGYEIAWDGLTVSTAG